MPQTEKSSQGTASLVLAERETESGVPGRNTWNAMVCVSMTNDYFIFLLTKSKCLFESASRSVGSDSLQPHRLYSPWNSPGQNIAVGSLSLLQEIFRSLCESCRGTSLLVSGTPSLHSSWTHYHKDQLDWSSNFGSVFWVTAETHEQYLGGSIWAGN